MKTFNPVLKNVALLSGILAALMIFPACDPFGVKSTGDIETRTFNEKDFTGLDICVPAEVVVKIDDTFSVEITCEETAMNYVETEVSDGILKIYFDRNLYDVEDMTIVVTAPSWDYFDLSGSGHIQVQDSISGQILRMDVSGSGRINVPFADFIKANLDISGSGNIRLGGIGDVLNCDISGSGDADCLQFTVNTADLEVSGSGNIQAHVLEFLEAEVSGSGIIEYAGDPQVSAHVSGSGKVRKL